MNDTEIVFQCNPNVFFQLIYWIYGTGLLNLLNWSIKFMELGNNGFMFVSTNFWYLINGHVASPSKLGILPILKSHSQYPNDFL